MSDKKKEEQSLTAAFEELEKITGEFERGEVDLEKGIPKFKRGLELARTLKKRLSEIENEIEEIKTKFKDVEGEPITPQDVEIEPELGPEEDSEKEPF